MKRIVTMSKLAIPYRRYSSDAQTGNSSLERQQQMIDEWLNSKEGEGFTTSPAFTYCDSAVSGFSGSHITKGDLGRFLDDLLEKGKFKEYETPTLLIENVDRFGRQKATKAIALLTDILEAGVNVYFLSTRQLLTKEIDDTALLMFVLESTRAHRESQRKSEMVSKAWDYKMDAIKEGKTLTKNVPWWVNPEDRHDTTSIEYAARQHIIKRVFDMRLKGKSCNAIAKVLNGEGVAVPSHRKPRVDKKYIKQRNREKWTGAVISALLANRAVLGELAKQTMTASNSVILETLTINGKKQHVRELKPGKALRPAVPGYFPEVVTVAAFSAVQLLKEEYITATDENGNEYKKPAGRRATATLPNSIKLFRRILRCSACGGFMTVSGNRAKYDGVYRCVNIKSGACDESTISRREVDSALIQRLIPNLSALNVNDSLECEIAKLENELDQHIAQRKNMLDFVMVSGMDDDVKERLQHNKKQQEDLNTQLMALKTQRNATEFETLEHLDLTTFEGRTEAQVLIKRMFKTIRLDTDKRSMNILLVNGSEYIGFEVDGKRNLQSSVKNSDERNQELTALTGIGGGVVVPAGEIQEASPIDYDSEQWPEA